MKIFWPNQIQGKKIASSREMSINLILKSPGMNAKVWEHSFNMELFFE